MSNECPYCTRPRWEFVDVDPEVHDIPPSDFVVRNRQGQHYRGRVWISSDGGAAERQYVNKLSSSFVNLKLSIAECDATGDVLEDAQGYHVIYDAKVCAFRTAALKEGPDGRIARGFDGQVGEQLAELLERAEAASAARRTIFSRFPVGGRPRASESAADDDPGDDQGATH